MRSGDTTLGDPRRDFPPTSPNMVSRVRDSSTRVRRDGLDELCSRYWKPVYYFIRIGWAKSNEDAKDLTQNFFLWLVERGALRRYEVGRASFRTFLKALLRHFLQRQHAWASRRKRGGGLRSTSAEDHLPELSRIPDDGQPRLEDPGVVFDREWLAGLMARAVERVRERFRAHEGQARRFRVFESYDLCARENRPTYAALAATLGLRESDVRNYLFAVREEVRAEARAEIAATSRGQEELEGEWRELLGD